MHRVLIPWLMAKNIDLKLLGISSSLKPKGAIPESLQFKNLSTRSENCNATQKDGKQQEFEFDTDNHPLSTHTSSIVFDRDKEQSGANNTLTSNADDYFLDGSTSHGADLHSKVHVAESKVKNNLIHHSLSEEHVQDAKSEATNNLIPRVILVGRKNPGESWSRDSQLQCRKTVSLMVGHECCSAFVQHHSRIPKSQVILSLHMFLAKNGTK